jgi:uncharacterized protein YndB with AHSA1/START domain
MSDRRMVRREVPLAVPREEAWAAVTEPGRLSAWFGADVDIELRPGGEAWFRWPDGRMRWAVVEVVDPPRRLSFLWEPDDERGTPTRVVFTLIETAHGSRLVVVETEVTASVSAIGLRPLDAQRPPGESPGRAQARFQALARV